MTLEQRLRASGVGEAVIARVLRLNPRPQEGVRLRGMHYTTHRDLDRHIAGYVKPSWIRAQYGEEVLMRLPRSAARRDGRRQWFPLSAIEEVIR